MTKAGRGDGPQGSDWRRFALLALFLFAFDLWMRWPGLSNQGFASHDVAGITYNAMLLGSGGLPYVDSVELKAPGTFYLATGVQALTGGPGIESVTALLRLANLLASLVLVVVTGMAWRAWGLRSALVAGTVYLSGAAFLDSMDANYVTWANAWAVMAMACAWKADDGEGSRLGPWLVAGLFAGAAALSKRPVGVVLPVVLLWAFRSGGGLGLRRSVSVLGGVALVHLPILIHYAMAGELPALIEGYVFNQWGGAYVSRKSPGMIAGLTEGMSATLHFLAFPVAVSALALAGRFRGGPAEEGVARRRTRALIGWAALTWAASFVGWRFYKGYFVPLLPPLALLAAHPAGLVRVLSAARGDARGRVVAALLSAGLGLLCLRQALLVEGMRAGRARSHDVGGRKIADFLQPRLMHGDRIWVWGWHLWDVYTYTGTPSASRIYKSLGLLTPPNDDTWRGGGSPLRFVDGEPARLLLSDFDAQPPRYIVLGSTVPQREFEALREFLRRDYRRVRGPRIGRVQYWEHKGEAPSR